MTNDIAERIAEKINDYNVRAFQMAQAGTFRLKSAQQEMDEITAIVRAELEGEATRVDALTDILTQLSEDGVDLEERDIGRMIGLDEAAKIANEVATHAQAKWNHFAERQDSSAMKVFNGRELAAVQIEQEIRSRIPSPNRKEQPNAQHPRQRNNPTSMG